MNRNTNGGAHSTANPQSIIFLLENTDRLHFQVYRDVGKAIEISNQLPLSVLCFNYLFPCSLLLGWPEEESGGQGDFYCNTEL